MSAPAGIRNSWAIALKRLGYVLGGFGKWGLGPVGSTGDPNQQGFDRFFGYNCQAVAHNFYPTYLWDNQTKVPLDNPEFSAHQKFPADGDPDDRSQYRRYQGTTYAPDRIHAEALNFLAEQRERPFFLYYPTTIPHLALQVPEESLAEYVGKFPETPYLGGQGYVPHMTPRAAYAAMVTHLDRQIGELLDAVHAYGLDEETIVVLTSDNGPAPQGIGGTDSAFFESALGSRGLKGSNYEGGIRVPGLVRWTGHLAAGQVIDRVTGFEDWFPTLLDLAGQTAAVPTGLDGISFAPTLRGEPQAERPFLYREIPGNGGQQSIRVGSWKAIRSNLNRPAKNTPPGSGAVELYDLAADPGETRDLAAEHPDKVAELTRLMATQHRPSTLFPIRLLDAPPTP